MKKKKQLCEGWKWKSTTITDETLTFWSSGDNNIIGRRKSRAFTENPWRALRNGGAFTFTFFYILWLFVISFATEVIYSLSDYLHIWIVLAFYYRNCLIDCISGWFCNPRWIRNTRGVLRVKKESLKTCIYVFALLYVNLCIYIFICW